ncbi:MAG TPA: SDR family oxidoreductase [Chloroflexota bacterium]
MHSLVTGGAGFIGSHMATELLRRGHRVTVLDNMSSGRMTNLGHLDGSPQLRFVQADVADLKAIQPHFEGVDWVFHFAGLADIVPSISQPAAYHHSNVEGTLAVLQAAHRAGVRRLVYAASSTCYGLPDVFPTPEDAPIRPQYPYALTKWVGEQYALHWAQVYGLPCVSLRMFNVYGPRSRTNGTYGAVFGVFLAQKLAGQPYTVVGDGRQTRDFTYVSDVVEAFIAAAESSACGEVFNVGSGGTYSVNRLVELLGGPVVHIPKRPGEPDCTFADTAKIRRTLGWRPSVSLQDGVARMLEHIEYWRDAPVWDPASIAEANRDWFEFLGKEQAAAA